MSNEVSAITIDGKARSEAILSGLAPRVKALVDRGVNPHLTVILVGDDPASQVYVKHKVKACQTLGIRSTVVRLPAATPEAELLDKIGQLNNDETVHGILVQLPLPKGFDEMRIVHHVAPEKDVDVFHPVNAGKLLLGMQGFEPGTPKGIIALLDGMGYDPAGKHAVVVGRSNIVGKPIALLLLRRNATVTICHSRTPDLGSFTRQADLLIAAVGKAGLITGDMIKPGATVIDVGVNRIEGSKKLYGDVDFDSAVKVAGAITPVPGGVGPMTISMLMLNTLEAAESFLT
ncbi:bifunctional protein FolD [Clostridia bacterium]|nr:bifunctional protein FolD [Clostridia bacterium]